jgi:hypothetical protein
VALFIGVCHFITMNQQQQQPTLLAPSKLGRLEMKPSAAEKIEAKTKVKKKGQ